MAARRYNGGMNAPMTLTRAQVRRVDQIAIEQFGIPGVVLMENAGRGVVDALLEFDPGLTTAGQVVVLCGRGNNAGDGFVIARHLAIRGVDVRTVLTAPAASITGDAAVNLRILQRCGAPLVELAPGDTPAALDRAGGGAAWLIDALLGTGAAGAPREPLPEIIAWMNAQRGRRLAVDLPSGLDCDSGDPAPTTVRATLTCTFVAAKPGLLAPAARPFVGELRVLSIGAPAEVVRQATADR